MINILEILVITVYRLDHQAREENTGLSLKRWNGEEKKTYITQLRPPPPHPKTIRDF